MSYNCEILADSLSPQGDRLTTMKITFPRIMLAEFNTHRMFSRNSASSRAIPFKKMVQMVQENPFIPIAWQKDHKGMQGTEYFTEDSMISNTNKPVKISKRRNLHYSAANKFKPLLTAWHLAKKEAIEKATALHNAGVTKQLCNRLLEPFMWHTVIVTSGKEGLDNFYKLRCPQYDVNGNLFRSRKDALEYTATTFHQGRQELIRLNSLGWLSINKSQADIHIQAIAELMWDSYNESIPEQLVEGMWHIPFMSKIDSSKLKSTKGIDITNEIIKISVARCARISYTTLGNNPKIDYEADIRLHDMLAESGHWSPFEHVARAMSDEEYGSYFCGRAFVNSHEPNYKAQNEYWLNNSSGWCKNFRGFIQYRHLIENNNENISH